VRFFLVTTPNENYRGNDNIKKIGKKCEKDLPNAIKID
jgi:hypothetical protein